MRKQFSRSGFTLVELSLSIAFISILSITIVVIINDMILSYQKGLVMKQVNTVGSELIDDFRASIASSSAGSLSNLCDSATSSEEDCYKSIFISKSANIKIGNKQITAPVYGAFCSGSYSYIWNSGYFFNSATYKIDSAVARASFSHNGTNYGDNFRLLKVPDITRSVCANHEASDENNFSLSSSLSEDQIIELFPSDSNLALYDLYVSKPARSSQSSAAYYSGSFILATIQGGINVKASGNYCATPSDYTVENFDYCAINKFNFAMQASGV